MGGVLSGHIEPLDTSAAERQQPRRPTRPRLPVRPGDALRRPPPPPYTVSTNSRGAPTRAAASPAPPGLLTSDRSSDARRCVPDLVEPLAPSAGYRVDRALARLHCHGSTGAASAGGSGSPNLASSVAALRTIASAILARRRGRSHIRRPSARPAPDPVRRDAAGWIVAIGIAESDAVRSTEAIVAELHCSGRCGLMEPSRSASRRPPAWPRRAATSGRVSRSAEPGKR
jgi:hypothetical protein